MKSLNEYINESFLDMSLMDLISFLMWPLIGATTALSYNAIKNKIINYVRKDDIVTMENLKSLANKLLSKDKDWGGGKINVSIPGTNAEIWNQSANIISELIKLKSRTDEETRCIAEIINRILNSKNIKWMNKLNKIKLQLYLREIETELHSKDPEYKITPIK